MKAKLEDGSYLYFLCDRKACGEQCPNEHCSHTSDIYHAANFDYIVVNDRGLTDFFELEQKTEASIM